MPKSRWKVWNLPELKRSIEKETYGEYRERTKQVSRPRITRVPLPSQYELLRMHPAGGL